MQSTLADTGERIIPPSEEEVSFVFARHRFAYQYAAGFVKDCMVVDIGCGTGYGCRMLAEHARFVCGIDYEYHALSYSQRNFGAPNVHYVQMNAIRLGLRRGFDVAVCFQVIEHLSDVDGFLSQLKRIVKPDGRILISTPNVPKDRQARPTSPFHESEMDSDQFGDLIGRNFSDFDILGVVYERRNTLRTAIQKLPFYRWGLLLKRTSGIKKLANRVMDLTSFRVTDKDLERSMDLLAVCRNT
jgi:SAM-dependent methyltransferase